MTAETRARTAPQDGRDAEMYQYLERRPHRWRKQLYLKGRNITVGQFVWNMQTNGHTPESTAANYELPLEQVREALRYYERHGDVIERDEQEERRRLIAAGIIVDPPPAHRRELG
jgi:uncharacterized protein (DUF433 family)